MQTKKLKDTIAKFVKVNQEYVKATKEERKNLERKWNIWHNKVDNAIAELDVENIDFTKAKK